MKTVLVYDDRRPVPPDLTTLIGVPRFGEIVFRRQRLAERIASLAHSLNWALLPIESAAQAVDIEARLAQHGCQRVVHLPAWLVPGDEALAIDRLARLGLASEVCRATIEDAATELFAAAPADYLAALPTIGTQRPASLSEQSIVPIDRAFIDVSDLVGLVDFLSGAFSARHFNRVTRTRQQVVKFSTNARKIRAEHDFYQLLPEAMRRWFVMPYDFKEGSGGASYTMERLLMLDMGQQWINGGLAVADFERFLEDVLRFFEERGRRPCSKQRAQAHFDALYVDKLRTRQADLAALPLGAYLDDMLRNGTRYESLARLVDAYLDLIAPYRSRLPDHECIGHGDPCFSNILYDQRIRLLKLIDPKGAIEPNELYTDPYYDFAKLSHSVLGGYDFVVNGLYEVVVDADLRLRLVTPEQDFDAYASPFVRALEARDIDVRQVRLYEASLFLSMLPLHRDSPRNVLAFALVAAHILDEIQSQ